MNAHPYLCLDSVAAPAGGRYVCVKDPAHAGRHRSRHGVKWADGGRQLTIPHKQRQATLPSRAVGRLADALQQLTDRSRGTS